jgi:hypothetical protein
MNQAKNRSLTQVLRKCKVILNYLENADLKLLIE